MTAGTLPVLEPWFAVDRPAPGVTRIREPGAHRLMRANAFLIAGRDRDVLFDTGLGVADIAGLVRGLTDRPLVVVASHCHLDHIGGHAAFAGAEILVHPAEAAMLARPEPATSLAFDQFGAAAVAMLAGLGFDTTRPLLDALPSPGFDVDGFRCRGVAPTRLIEEGDQLDLGDRSLDVLHLPGHSPGSIGLFDPASGALFSGDAVYDGILIDSLPGGDPAAYRRTFHRLLALAPAIVHGGHNDAVGPERLAAIAAGYLAG